MSPAGTSRAPARSAGTMCSAASTSLATPAGSAANTPRSATPSWASPGASATGCDRSSSADAELIAHLADLAVDEVDFEHVLRRPDPPDRGMAFRIKDLGSVVAVFVRRDIAVIAVDREGQPVRAAAAAQRQRLLHDRGHRISHIPDIDVRIAWGAALPDLVLIGCPADSVH